MIELPTYAVTTAFGGALAVIAGAVTWAWAMHSKMARMEVELEQLHTESKAKEVAMGASGVKLDTLLRQMSELQVQLARMEEQVKTLFREEERRQR